MTGAFSNTLQFLLLAQTRIEALNQGFRDRNFGQAGDARGMLILALGAVLCALAIYYGFRFRQSHPINNPRKLLAELAAANCLTGRQRRLLGKLARAKKIDDPTQLMIDASLWVLDPVHEVRLCKPRILRRIQHIHRLLFEELKEAMPDHARVERVPKAGSSPTSG